MAAKSISQRAQEAIEVPDEVADTGSRKPDFIIRVRQPDYVKDGKRYRSDRFTTVGAAWKQTDKNGREFLGCKCNVPGMIMPESFLLYPPYEEGQ
jgi:uncharacterized protein (DUF736 family)